MNAVRTKPSTGKLLWIDNETKTENIIRMGAFSLLQHIRTTLKQDPVYQKGKFKITY